MNKKELEHKLKIQETKYINLEDYNKYLLNINYKTKRNSLLTILITNVVYFIILLII